MQKMSEKHGMKANACFVFIGERVFVDKMTGIVYNEPKWVCIQFRHRLAECFAMEGRKEPFAAPENRMDNRARGVRLIAALMVILCMLCNAAVAFAAADPVRVSSLSEPQSVISEQEVNITIKVYNSSQEDLTGDIILYDPSGSPLETYNGLKGENSVTYTGKWNVTSKEIEAGKIKFYIRYTVETENGPQENTRTVPVTIQTEAAVPQLTATYSVSPTSAKEGQEVTLSYTLSNTGNVELRNIVIENEGVTKSKVNAVSLSVGEKVTLTDTFTMGSKELVSKPQVTYQAAGSKKEMTISDMARKTITVAEDGLEVAISAKNTDNIYPGEEVAFTLEMKNTGNTPYTGLNALLADGTAVAEGVELAPGASYSGAFTLEFTEKAAVSVSVSGSDDSGNPVSMGSNEITVTASRALVLDVSAKAEKDIIYEEPAVVRFAVLVKNTGETDATNLVVRQNNTTVATIPSLPSGESRTLLLNLETSIAGQFRFDVSGKDAAGVEKVYSSDVIKVAYMEPTPVPTAVPTPTPPPPTPTPVPTATPVPTLGEIISEHVNVKVLYAIAGVLGALLVAIFAAHGVQSAKYKKRMAGAYDTIEFSSGVRNHRGVEKKRRNAKTPKSASEPVKTPQAQESEEQDDVQLLPLKADAEAEASAKAEPVQEENRRRRAGVQVTNDATLRVAPVDERPEFVAQGKVDDSQTRIFGRQETEATKEALDKAMQDVGSNADAAKAPSSDTMRFDRSAIDEVKRREEAGKASKGKKRDEIKPMKKKKGLFAKKDRDDDLVDADDDLDDGEDDFIE